jgi:hypothetical protein
MTAQKPAAMIKFLPMLVSLFATLPIAATAGEWHMISDEVNPGVPINGGFVVGAIPVESIKITGGQVEAEVAMFYVYDLAIEAKAKILGSHSDLHV